MEQQLSSKMAELLNVLDQVKKYREIAASMIDLAIILSATIVAVLGLVISGNLWTIFNGVSIPGNHYLRCPRWQHVNPADYSWSYWSGLTSYA